MAGQTGTYGLKNGLQTDDVMEAADWNRMAETVDRVVGGIVTRMMAAGALTGWELMPAGTVSAGEGLVGGCWCRTTTAQAIEGLTPGAINHVFAGATAASATAGAVRFWGALSETPTAGAIYLGRVTVAATGEVTEVDSGAPGVSRNCRRLEVVRLHGSGTAAGVQPGASATVAITHETALMVPGAVTLTANAGFTVECGQTHGAFGFVLTAHNTSGQAADLAYTWERYGLVL